MRAYRPGQLWLLDHFVAHNLVHSIKGHSSEKGLTSEDKIWQQPRLFRLEAAEMIESKGESGFRPCKTERTTTGEFVMDNRSAKLS